MPAAVSKVTYGIWPRRAPFRLRGRLPRHFVVRLAASGLGDSSDVIADEKSMPIESPMLFSAGSCSAMPRMLSIT